MTNHEKYTGKLISMFAGELGVDMFTGEPEWCENLDCNLCANKKCSMEFIADWLNAEYEPPKDNIELATLIAYLKQEPNQMKRVKSIKIVDGMPVINGGD